MNKPAWFKLYSADFLADRNVERMSLEEFGLYCYLLMRGWLDGGIPASLDEIARYAMLRGISRKRLSKLWSGVSPCWEKSAGDESILINPRQEIERKNVADYWNAKSRAGRASATKRKQQLRQKDEGATCVEQMLNTLANNIDSDSDTAPPNPPTGESELFSNSLSFIDNPPFETTEPSATFSLESSQPKAEINGTLKVNHSELDSTLDRVAASVYARHPAIRRNCGVAIVRKKLEAILKHKRIPVTDRVAYLGQLDRNHTAMCATDEWTKDGSKYAKALENWLASTKDRYLIAPAKSNSQRSTTREYIPPDGVE